MMMDGYDGELIFGDLGGLKLPDICLTGEEKPRKNLTQETCPDRGSNRARCVTGPHATACSTEVDMRFPLMLPLRFRFCKQIYRKHMEVFLQFIRINYEVIINLRIID